MLGWIVTKGCP